MGHIQWVRFRPARNSAKHALEDRSLRRDKALKVEGIERSHFKFSLPRVVIGPTAPRRFGKLDPGRRVIARVFAAADLAVDTGRGEALRRRSGAHVAH